MGMAASQARYLALTARKTNTEWEGQQINQARTALANQSANLFNRLLGLEVPNAPKTTDYTELQYSYSDGENESVIEKWEQLSNKNPDYNYSVKHYYMADIFTGAKKLLQDPQIQMGNVLKELNYDPKNSTISLDANGNITVTYKIENVEQEQQYTKITDEQVERDNNLKTALTNFETAKNMAKSEGTLTTDAIYGYQDASGTWHFYVANEYSKINASQVEQDAALEKALKEFEEKYNLLNDDGSVTIENIFGSVNSGGEWDFTIDGSHAITQQEVDEDAELKAALTTFETNNYMINDDGTLNLSNIHGYKYGDEWRFYLDKDSSAITAEKADADAELKAALRTFEEAKGIIPAGGDLVYDDIRGYKTGSKWNFFMENSSTINNVNIAKSPDDTDYSVVYGPAFVGNSKLTELNKLVVDSDRDQVADIAQILRDCPDSAVSKYASFDDMGNLVYSGSGIYTFDLYGKSYYTTYEDLINSVNSTYDGNKPIDTQKTRMPYYTASYIPTKVEETNYALLETDGQGRFKSVKFDNDSVVYNLNVETVTNEAAYQDAMNEYLYKKEQYEKTIADINAKTSIIQQEDRTLELRLKQLDTEQNALATEMDAVKKVIKDNVEKTFKTFSD